MVISFFHFFAGGKRLGGETVTFGPLLISDKFLFMTPWTSFLWLQCSVWCYIDHRRIVVFFFFVQFSADFSHALHFCDSLVPFLSSIISCSCHTHILVTRLHEYPYLPYPPPPLLVGFLLDLFHLIPLLLSPNSFILMLYSDQPWFICNNRVFSKHRPSGPMLSISRNVRPSVCVSVCLSVHFWGTV